MLFGFEINGRECLDQGKSQRTRRSFKDQNSGALTRNLLLMLVEIVEGNAEALYTAKPLT